jgi:predicted transcriptional regulator
MDKPEKLLEEAENIKERLSETVEFLMKKHKVSTAKLAQTIGVKRQALHETLNKRSPKIETLIHVLKHLIELEQGNA